MSPLLHDYHVRVLLPCYRETPEMVRSGTCKGTSSIQLLELKNALTRHARCVLHICWWAARPFQPTLCTAPPLHVHPSLQIRTTAQAVLAAHLPPGCRRTVYVCDDGKDPVKRVGDSCCAISSLGLSAHERILSGVTKHAGCVLRRLADIHT
jgi:hypothetical protein